MLEGDEHAGPSNSATAPLGELLSEALSELEELKSSSISVHVDEATFAPISEIKYPYKCYSMSGQENACKLTPPSELPTEIRGIYRVDPGLTNVYATRSTLLMGVQACVYSVFGKAGQVTVSGMSAMTFRNTRPSTPSSQHNFGRAFDVKLQGRMKSNGAAYDRLACAYLCLYCVEAGASMVIFSDQEVVDAVNKATNKSVCRNIAGHENHIHLDGR